MNAADPRGGDAPGDVPGAQERLVAALRDECNAMGVSARGFDRAAFLDGARAFAREARSLGAPAERMLVLLKQCLLDERLPREDRELYERYRDGAMTAAIAAYYDTPSAPPSGHADSRAGDATPRDMGSGT
jgi:hypothetical protein